LRDLPFTGVFGFAFVAAIFRQALFSCILHDETYLYAEGFMPACKERAASIAVLRERPMKSERLLAAR